LAPKRPNGNTWALVIAARIEGIGLSPKNRNILFWMCLLIFANQLGFGSVVPVVALYAENFGVTKTAIGLTIGIYGLARFLVNYPSGRLSEQIGRKPTLAIGGVITVIGCIVCAVAPNYPLFLSGRFIAGAGAAFVLTAGQIVLADIASPHNRGRVMAIYMGVFVFAVGAGSFPGGWLATHIGLSAPFWANAILAAMVTALAFFFVPETKPEPVLNPEPKAANAPRELRGLAGFREQLVLFTAIQGFALISIVSFVTFFARTGGLFNVIPLLAEDEIGLRPDQIGMGIGMISIVGLVLVYPSGMLVDRYGRKAVIVPSALCSAGAMLLFILAGSYGGFLVASFFWAVASGVSGAAPAAYAADLAPPGKVGPAMGLYRTIADLGYVIGPLMLGVISDLISPQAALHFTALILVLSGLLFLIKAPETLPERVVVESSA
jgi:multidrug resistance protein